MQKGFGSGFLGKRWQETMCKCIAESRIAMQTSQEAAGIPSTTQPCSGEKCTVASLCNNVQHLPNLSLRNLRTPRPINPSTSWKVAHRNVWTQPLMATQHLFGNNRAKGISSLLCSRDVRHILFVLWGPEHKELFQWLRTGKWQSDLLIISLRFLTVATTMKVVYVK